MKITKRTKISMAQSIFMHFIFLCILVFIISSLSSHIQEIEQKKYMGLELYNKIEEIKGSGITYDDFTEYIQKNNPKNSGIIEEIDEKFFNKNFFNTEDGSYREFLTQLRTHIFTIQSSDEFQEKEQLINTILPYYHPNSEIIPESLSDFHFINSIENILYDFNINYEGDIGVGKLQKLEEGDMSISSRENVYFIPLNLRIEGRKSNIIDLLHFFENVGNIIVQDNELKVYDDNFISSFQKSDRSIYQKQFAEIVSISMSQYPDSSTIVDENDLITLLKGSQARERIELDITLHFYVFGLPGYKIQEFIETFLGNYDEFTNEVEKQLQIYKNNSENTRDSKKIQSISFLESLSLLLMTLNEEIDNIRIDIAKRTDLDILFDKVWNYNRQLEYMQEGLKQQIEILDNN